MKKYKIGIVLGIISIITSILFVGVPSSLKGLSLLNIIIFSLGLLLIIIISLLKVEDKYLLIYIISYLVIEFNLTAIIESSAKDYTLLLLGWLPGLVISIIGLLKGNQNKKIYNIKTSKILNIIGLVLSIINLIGGLVINKGIIIM